MLQLAFDDIIKTEFIKKEDAILIYVYDIHDNMTVAYITKKSENSLDMLRRAVNEIYFTFSNANEFMDIVELSQEEKNDVLQNNSFDVKNDTGYICKVLGKPLCYLYY